MLDPTLKIITNTKIAKCVRTIGHMDGYIILPLREFKPMAYSRMRLLQLYAAKMIAKNRREQQDIRTEKHTDL